MTVYFIGAGPGAPDLLTLRGRDLIAKAPVCLYAGSLIPVDILAFCPQDAKIVNTASMALDDIILETTTAHDAGLDVVRLHSGDLSIWSALGEQLRRLKAVDIPVEIVPGVPAFAAAAAALEVELTLPEQVQSVVLTRMPGRASKMPDAEKLATFAQTGATLAIHLSIHVLDKVVEELLPFYGAACPVAIIWRASWPDQDILRGNLGQIANQVEGKPSRTALILVGQAVAQQGFAESRLYASDYDRRFRPQGSDALFPETAGAKGDTAR